MAQAVPQVGSPVTPPSQDFLGSSVSVSVHKSADRLLHLTTLYIPQNPEVYLTSVYSPPSGAKKVGSTIKTSFWPTCVRPIANGMVLVAGKNRRSGATVIEVWTMNPPTLFPASTPGGQPTLVPGSIADINPVYSGNEAGKLLVRQALPHRGVPGGAIIQFDDSRDLYALNTASGVMTPIASPDATRAASQGCFHAPLLSQTTGGAAAELVQSGYVYEFRIRGAANNIPSRVQFFDSDKNGSIDAMHTLTIQEWTAAGYANSSAWVQHDF
jgi:hypothetical protein